jgi:hypothetical protein
MLLYATVTNEHKKIVKIGGNTALTITAHLGNKIVGEVVLLEGSLALYNTKGELEGEIQLGKKRKGNDNKHTNGNECYKCDTPLPPSGICVNGC